MANRMAIHHPRALGAHHVEPTAGFWCLRWWRDSHRTSTPSGRTRSTNVAGVPMLSSLLPRFRVVMPPPKRTPFGLLLQWVSEGTRTPDTQDHN